MGVGGLAFVMAGQTVNQREFRVIALRLTR
jgi:hypothetical protein